MRVKGRYPAFAAFFALRAVFGCDFASAFFFTAHRCRIRSAAACRWAAENFRRFFLAGAEAATGEAAATAFFGGRPLRCFGP